MAQIIHYFYLIPFKIEAGCETNVMNAIRELAKSVKLGAYKFVYDIGSR